MAGNAFSFPAQYTRVVESALALVAADIGRDVKMRANESDPAWVEKMAVVPTAQLEPDRSGRIVVMIVPEVTEDAAHLHAFSPTPR